MTWVKLDVRFPTHTKTLDVGPVAEALWLRGLCYAGAHLTDGFIPFGFVRRMNDLDGQAEADRLADAGLWETADGGWLIHDYLEYQRSRDDAEDLSIKRAEAGRRGGKQRASKLLEANASKPKQTGEANVKQIREEEIREEQKEPPLSPKGETPALPEKEPTYPKAMETFWNAYDAQGRERSSRSQVFAVWARMKPSDELTTAIMEGLAQWTRSEKWRDGFAPGAHLFLKRRLWAERPALPTAPKPSKGATALDPDEYRNGAHLRQRGRL